MINIKLENKKQLHILMKALELYSRIGTLQLDFLLDHPSINKIIMDNFTEKGELKVGDQTFRGEVIELGGYYVKTKGNWNGKEEIKKWEDLENIKKSPNWNKFHRWNDYLKLKIKQLKNLIFNEINGNFSIHSQKIDESCRDSYDMLQVMRHELWKLDDNNSHSISSNVDITSKNNFKIEVSINEKKFNK